MSWIKVLVAGSDAGRRTALVNILSQCALEPAIASNVAEARTILAQRPVHVVFCEDNLPDGDFRDILRLVKTTRPEIQVVVSSMLRDLDEYIEAVNLGAFDFVAPPYRSTDIVPVVDSACERYHLKRKDGTVYYIQAQALPPGGKSVA